MISLDSILNFGEIFDSIGEFIDTDASMNEALELLGIIKDADFHRVYSHRLPGKEGMKDGVFLYSTRKELHKVVKDFIEEDNVERISSKSHKIIVKNSGTSDENCKKIVEALTRRF